MTREERRKRKWRSESGSFRYGSIGLFKETLMNRRNKKNTFLIFILTQLAALIMSYIISLHVFLLICFSLLFLCLAVSFLIKYLPEKAQTVVSSVRNIGFYSLLLIMGVIFHPFYLYSVSGAFVYILSAVVGIVTGIAYALWKRKSMKPWKLAGRSVLVAFGALVVSIILVLHANYAFDFNEPTEYAVEIEDKDHHFRSRHKYTTRMFTVTVEGKTFDIHVPKSHYEYYEIGDTYYVYRYNGALGQPFYLSYAYAD